MERITESRYKYHDCEFADNGMANYMNRLRKYEDAEEQGLLVRMPCKVGDTVYEVSINKNTISDYVVTGVDIGSTGKITLIRWSIKKGIYLSRVDGFFPRAIGERIFLTQSEAEQALEGMEVKQC